MRIAQMKKKINEAYEARYREQQIKYLQKEAAKFGFQLAPP